MKVILVYALFAGATLFAGTAPLGIETGGSCSDAGLSAPDHAPPIGDPRDRIFYPSDTERVKPLARKLVSNILMDQKDIWTSPFHINRHNAGWWALGAAGTAAFIAADRPLSRQLENSKGQVLAGNRVSKLGATYTVIPAAAGFYLAGVFTDNAKARETGVLGTEAMLDSLIVSSVLKTAFSRNRPNARKDAGDFFSGGNSFPSGHAIQSWALASVVAHEYASTVYVPVIAYGLATLVTGARFAAQQHYAGDLFAGAAMGWFIGTYVYRTHEEHLGHMHRAVNRIRPEIRPSTGTYAVSFNLGR